MAGGNGKGTDSWITRDTFFLHAVGSEKETKLFKVGQWHFNRSCTLHADELSENMPPGFRKLVGA
eukprot:CAMPEP_0198233590 /NCGR_PEP_ID=MMETSP1445-20131203/116317_1 /TAXON_ID=36898 /ORGANISM="Pyramimonas sp., Strain CCMP2087" /LENGTH=64 /DNA_ID=CAMNT_0043914289 /DNA_START=481 /DNA_END=675 /DNA_ORIENTATION=+